MIFPLVKDSYSGSHSTKLTKTQKETSDAFSVISRVLILVSINTASSAKNTDLVMLSTTSHKNSNKRLKLLV